MAGVLCLGFMLLGVALRVQRYLLGRSFRNDEASLAGALNSHTLLSLITRPLGGVYTAPVGFVVIEKLSTMLAGNHDYVFRLFPLLMGIASVPLMYYLATRTIGPAGAVFCIAAFSLNWMSVFYSSDLKQYSSDVLFALLILLAAANSYERNTRRDDLVLGAVGVVAVAFSHPAVYILAVVAPVLLWQRGRQPESRRRIVLIGAAWGAVFLLLYVLFYRTVGQVDRILAYWEDTNGIMPIPPWKDWGWFTARPGALLSAVGGLSPITVIPTAFYVLGLVSFARRGRWEWAAWVFGSAIATLGGAALVNYPFKGRLILFLVPGAMLTIGEGVQCLAGIVRLHGAGRALAWLAAAALLWTPAMNAAYQLQQPRSAPYPEDIKPVLGYVRHNLQPEDLIVVYSGAELAYRYYASFYGLQENQTYYLPEWQKTPGKYQGFIDALPRNQRVWLVFCRVDQTKDNVDERNYLLDYVRASGGELLQEDSISGGISSVHLVILK